MRPSRNNCHTVENEAFVRTILHSSHTCRRRNTDVRRDCEELEGSEDGAERMQVEGGGEETGKEASVACSLIAKVPIQYIFYV